MSEMTLDLSGDETEPGTPKTETADLDLAELWSAYHDETNAWSPTLRAKQRGFRDYLRELAADPEAIDSVVFCVRCDDPWWDEETVPLRGDSTVRVCEDCQQRYYTSCDNCEEVYPGDEVTTTLSQAQVCDSCRDENYSYCDDCEGWYRDGDADDHDHSESDESTWCCESPALDFTVRNDGCPPLVSGTQVTVTLPQGRISAEGLVAIREYLRVQASAAMSDRLYSLAYDLEALGDAWQDTRGSYAKRLSARAYKEYAGLKLSQAELSQVGVLARDHSNPVSVTVEFTRDLNMSAEDFYHEDSCWWGGYSYSRCTLKSNGGFGIRSFGERGDVTGRVWVLPLKVAPSVYGTSRLVPTFDTEAPDAFMLFNGYGDLDGYTAPRMLAHMAGWTYRKSTFRCEPMYVNAGGYLVGPEEVVRRFTDNVTLKLERHARLFAQEQAEKLEGAALHLSAEKEAVA